MSISGILLHNIFPLPGQDKMGNLLSKVHGDSNSDDWHEAVKSGDTRLLKTLFENLDTRTGISSLDESGQTPLQLALSLDKQKCVNQLFKYEKDDHGGNSWHRAVASGNPKLLELLSKNEKTRRGILSKNKEGLTPLHLSLSLKHKKCISFLYQSEMNTFCLLYTSPSPRDRG